MVVAGQVSDTGATGYLFSQPIVRTPDGEECRLDELLGPGFALVSRDGLPELSQQSRTVLETIGATTVSLEGVNAVKGHMDRLFEEQEAVIVRPDRLIFGHTAPDMTLDALIGVLAEKLLVK